jgi:hypothetical protein
MRQVRKALIKYGRKALNKLVAKETWAKVLKDGDVLPKDWFRECGVLVGVG